MKTEYHEPERIGSTRNSPLKAALETVEERSFAVLPVMGKTPLTDHGYRDASRDRSRVIAMFNAKPNATGHAIRTGQASRVVVVDVDGPGARAEAERRGLTSGYVVKTGRLEGDGWHVYLSIPKGVEVRSRHLAPGLELKAEGHYVVGPGSSHPKGGTYRLVKDGDPSPAPEWVLEEPEPCPRPSRRCEAVEVDDGGPIPEGTRNRTLASIGGRKRAQGLQRGDLEAHLLAVNAQRCTPPLDEGEVRRIAASVSRYEAGDASTGPSPKVRAKLAHLEEVARERPVRGMRGGSGWSIYNAALEAARQHGGDHPDGVELSLDVRTWAQMAGTHAATVSRFVRRSPLVRQLRRGVGRRAGSVVLLTPREMGGKLQHSTTGGCRRERSVADRPLFRTLYRLRWGPGRIGKTRAALLTKVVECPGVSRSELAHRLGRKPASLKKPLKWLVDAGLLERPGRGRYDVTADFSERLDDLRAAGREPEADRLQIRKHNDQRDGYRNRGKVKAEPVPERTTAELERVLDPNPGIVDALREFLRRNPDRRDQEPSWFSVALWSEDYLPTKPPPLAVEVALGELRRVAA